MYLNGPIRLLKRPPDTKTIFAYHKPWEQDAWYEVEMLSHFLLPDVHGKLRMTQKIFDNYEAL